MRKFFALFALLGCLMVAQSTLAATAAYGDCCLEGCQGVSQCVGLGCAVCVAPAAAGERSAAVFAALDAEPVAAGDEPQPPTLLKEVWTPPD